jgi:hypothetical protein
VRSATNRSAIRATAPVDPSAYARPLGPTEEHTLHHGLWQITVDYPVKRLAIHLLDGPEFWTDETPKTGDFAKYDLAPDTYVVQTVYEDGYVENRHLNIRGGSEERWVTHPYKRSAPIP